MRTRVALVTAGALLIAYAIGGVFSQIGVVIFLAAVLVLHDALWMPFVLLVGALLARTRRWTALVAVPVVRAVVRKKFARPHDDGDG